MGVSRSAIAGGETIEHNVRAIDDLPQAAQIDHSRDRKRPQIEMLNRALQGASFIVVAGRRVQDTGIPLEIGVSDRVAEPRFLSGESFYVILTLGSTVNCLVCVVSVVGELRRFDQPA